MVGRDLKQTCTLSIAVTDKGLDDCIEAVELTVTINYISLSYGPKDIAP